VSGVVVDDGRGSRLHHPAPVEDGDAHRDVPDHGEVVGDEEVAEAQLVLEAPQQAEHLGLHREVERADRLVADDQARPHDERPGDRDPLALSAGELVRVPVRGARLEPDALQDLSTERPGSLASIRSTLTWLRILESWLGFDLEISPVGVDRHENRRPERAEQATLACVQLIQADQADVVALACLQLTVEARTGVAGERGVPGVESLDREQVPGAA